MKKIFKKILHPYNFIQYFQYFVIRKIRSCFLYSALANCHRTVSFGKKGRIWGGEFITVGKDTFFDDFFFLTAWKKMSKEPFLKIGAYCNFGAFFHITCANEIIIGNHVLVGKWVTISDNNHGDSSLYSLKIHPCDRKVVSKGRIVIDDDVWIGDKATILSGVHIGQGSVVAANAVVTKDIPAYCVVAGNPAKIISDANVIKCKTNVY